MFQSTDREIFKAEQHKKQESLRTKHLTLLQLDGTSKAKRLSIRCSTRLSNIINHFQQQNKKSIISDTKDENYKRADHLLVEKFSKSFEHLSMLFPTLSKTNPSGCLNQPFQNLLFIYLFLCFFLIFPINKYLLWVSNSYIFSGFWTMCQMN